MARRVRARRRSPRSPRRSSPVKNPAARSSSPCSAATAFLSSSSESSLMPPWPSLTRFSLLVCQHPCVRRLKGRCSHPQDGDGTGVGTDVGGAREMPILGRKSEEEKAASAARKEQQRQ